MKRMSMMLLLRVAGSALILLEALVHDSPIKNDGLLLRQRD